MPEQTELHIKNMVCPRCVRVVREELEALGLPLVSVSLGKVLVNRAEEEIDLEQVAEILHQNGFELLVDRETQMVDAIKTALIHYLDEVESADPVPKMSTFLAGELNFSYEHLSKLFSRQEDVTIEKYFIHLKIERVKELLSYDELSLSEIAYKLKYSSVQHLSRQFKEITGLTVSEFKKHPYTHRHFLDRLT